MASTFPFGLLPGLDGTLPNSKYFAKILNIAGCVNRGGNAGTKATSESYIVSSCYNQSYSRSFLDYMVNSGIEMHFVTS